MTDPRRYYLTAEHVAELACVTTASVTESSGYDRVVVEVVVEPTEETVPARVLSRLATDGLGVADVTPQGTHLLVTAFA